MSSGHKGPQTHHEAEEVPKCSLGLIPHPHRERFGWVISKSHSRSRIARGKALVTIIPAGVAGEVGVAEKEGAAFLRLKSQETP